MSHNIIKDSRLIELDPRYKIALIEDRDLKFNFPTSDYFFTVYDLSINLKISLKWVLWSYFFFDSISKELKSDHYLKWDEIIDEWDSVNIPEKPHIILLDNRKIDNFEDLHKLIKDEYSGEYFTENTKIHMKLRLNLREYIVLTNMVKPILAITKTIHFK